MSILRSFNIGVTGLAATGGGMAVAADNIANAGTNGFKASRAEFQDILGKSLGGAESGGSQYGSGVQLAHIKPVLNQGDISRTDSVTDLAINGNGFFRVEAPSGFAFTRDGSMHFDKEGKLVTGDGHKVHGFLSGENGELTNKIGAIELSGTEIPATATKTVNILMNLDSRESIKQFDINNIDKTANFISSMTVFDNIGTERLITVAYNKTGDSSWKYRVLVDGKDAQGGTDGKFVQMGSGRLVFNNKGQLQQEVEESSSFNFNKGAAPGQKIKIDFGTSISEGGNGNQGVTQYGSNSTVSRNIQDGYSSATLASLAFDDDGLLRAVYTNGVARNIAQVAIAKFENPEALMKMGKNLFKSTRSSGQSSLGRPNEGGRGEIFSKSIELSNVDIAQELVNLMKGQRNFTANAKSLTTADEMLQEIINIKR